MARGFKMGGASGESGATVYINLEKTDIKEIKIDQIDKTFEINIDQALKNITEYKMNARGARPIVYGGYIYLIGCSYYDYHADPIIDNRNKCARWVYQSDSWVSATRISTYASPSGLYTIVNDGVGIFICGGEDANNNCRRYENGTWVNLTNFPTNNSKMLGVFYNNKVHIIGGSSNSKYHYSYYNGNWSREVDTPINVAMGSCAAVVLNNKIHLLTSDKRHYTWNGGSSWEILDDELPVQPFEATVKDDTIHIFNTYKHYKLIDSNWVKCADSSVSISSNGYTPVVTFNNKIHAFNTPSLGHTIIEDGYITDKFITSIT
jgi:hypothetical protein